MQGEAVADFVRDHGQDAKTTIPGDIIVETIQRGSTLSEWKAYNRVKAESEAGYTKWLIPLMYFEGDDHNEYYRGKLIDRQKYVLNDWSVKVKHDMFTYSDKQGPANHGYQFICDAFNVTWHRFDIGELIAGKEPVYQALLEFIGADPIEDWHAVLLKKLDWINDDYVEFSR